MAHKPMATSGFLSDFQKFAQGIMGRPDGRFSEFERRRGEWLQNITRESLLDSVSRLIISDSPSQDSRWRHVACLTPRELERVENVFEAHSFHKGESNYWNQDSLVQFLSTQAPVLSNASIVACSGTLYACVRYFAWYPFLPSDDDLLTYDTLVRSVTFLAGRQGRLFGNWHCKLFMEHPQGQYDIQRSTGDFFRSIGIPNDTPIGAVKHVPNTTEIQDILFQIQPTLNDHSTILIPDQFTEPARRLSCEKVALEGVLVSKDDMVKLLTFLIEMLDRIAMKDSQPSPLAGKLKALKLQIAQVESLTISYQTIESMDPNAFYHLQRAINVLFDMFLDERVINIKP